MKILFKTLVGVVSLGACLHAMQPEEKPRATKNQLQMTIGVLEYMLEKSLDQQSAQYKDREQVFTGARNILLNPASTEEDYGRAVADLRRVIYGPPGQESLPFFIAPSKPGESFLF